MMHPGVGGFQPAYEIVVQRCLEGETVLVGQEASESESQPGTTALWIGKYIVQRRSLYANQVACDDYRLPGGGPAV